MRCVILAGVLLLDVDGGAANAMDPPGIRGLSNVVEAAVDNQRSKEYEASRAYDQAYAQWLKDNGVVLTELCTTKPSGVHARAWKDHFIAVSTDPDHAQEAEKAGKRVVNCKDLALILRLASKP